MLPLRELGDRICILGPSNSGKSTLAAAIARATHAPAIHLDLLYHLPGTDWEPRSSVDFAALHDQAIKAPRWVMDGNYSALLPQRLARATGLILLDISMPRSLLRYIRRTVGPHVRVGALSGGRDSLKWAMLHHIACTTPRNRRRYAQLYNGIGLPRLRLASARQIDACYAAWNLTR